MTELTEYKQHFGNDNDGVYNSIYLVYDSDDFDGEDAMAPARVMV